MAVAAGLGDGSAARKPQGRVARAFAASTATGHRALIAYLTAGDPAPDRTVPLIRALERGGADILELGVPFSDPIADGPVIQAASERALATGTRVSTVIEMVRDLRRESELPVVVFSYLNPILRYGFERFADDAAEAGVDGALLTDLSVEESEQYVGAMRQRGLDCVFLATQTTPTSRIETVARQSSGFLYLVSRAGVTGATTGISNQAIPLVRRARTVTDLPLAVGFGLSTGEHMREVAPFVDGAVVGSAFMRMVASHQTDDRLEELLEARAAEYKDALQFPEKAGQA